MKDFRQILVEEESLDESSGAMYAIKNLMDKYKKTPSETEKQKIKSEMEKEEQKLNNNPYWKKATIGKDYENFKKETLDFA